MEISKKPTRVKVVVATSVMLSFISFWRAAAIVLNDLGSSAFYVGGISEEFVGKSAPWFIFGVMLFSYAVRALYIESSSMFTRGGVYRVVKEAMGGTMAKLSVSALIFDFILTGPISGVAAGQYIVGLIAQTMTYFGYTWDPAKDTINHIAAIIAIVITLYFWWRNIKGIHESSEDALRIMKIATVMVVMMIVWSLITLAQRGGQLPPLPTPENLSFNEDALGWLKHTGWFKADGERFSWAGKVSGLVGLIGVMMAFGHSILALSGEETLAQVNRELEYPKLKNLQKAGWVIFVYSMIFTSLVSFFAVAIIPDDVRVSKYGGNLISGLALNFVGPESLKLFFQAFVVLVGFIMLSGAVNTAIIGSNGVLNRISEDGVLTDWFRAPHSKYGTTYRLVNLIAILQILTIIGSRGDIFILGEAYAFGVIWSFTFNAIASVVLRFKHPEGREWRVPGNFRIRGIEIPFGLILIAMVLAFLAVVNLLTKQVATYSGIAFTAIFFVIFTISEYKNRQKLDRTIAALDQFQLQHNDVIDQQVVGVRPGSILVAVRDFNTLGHLETTLKQTNTDERDIVVMTTRLVTGPDGADHEIYDENLFTSYEQKLFTRVVALAEKSGKPVDLVIVPAANVFDAVAQTALQLDSSEIVAGLSNKMTVQEQERSLGRSWEALGSRPRREVCFRVLEPDGVAHVVYLGAHAPNLSDEDVALIHKLWLQISDIPSRRRVHHRDVVRVALNRLERDLRGHTDVMLDFYKLEQESENGKLKGKRKGADEIVNEVVHSD
jgi:amino acid transporter